MAQERGYTKKKIPGSSATNLACHGGSVNLYLPVSVLSYYFLIWGMRWSSYQGSNLGPCAGYTHSLPFSYILSPVFYLLF